MDGRRTPPDGLAVGLNHNIRYKDRVFHLQTEDLGEQGISTQLFLGGNVIASNRSVFAALVRDSIDSGQDLRQRMEAQHKSMARALLSGIHDRQILSADGTAVYEPGSLAGGVQAPPLLVGGSSAAPKMERAVGPTAKSDLPFPRNLSIPPPGSSSPAAKASDQSLDALSDEVIVRHLMAEFDDPA